MKTGCLFLLGTLGVISFLALSLVIALVFIDGTSMEMPSTDTTQLRAEAKEIEYDDLFRHNEQHIDASIVVTGTIIQTSSGVYGKIFRVQTEEDGVIWVNYADEQRFLEDDYVVVYGVVRGIKKYTSVVDTTIEIPEIDGYIIELLQPKE